jgi:hypothetical protein
MTTFDPEKRFIGVHELAVILDFSPESIYAKTSKLLSLGREKSADGLSRFSRAKTLQFCEANFRERGLEI